MLIMFRTKKQHTACDSCPIAKTADLIGDSIVLLIIRDLARTPRRFSELQASFPGVSTRTLTQKLKMLETEAMIVKQKYAEFPPRFEYVLTKKGNGLSGGIRAMDTNGKKYIG